MSRTERLRQPLTAVSDAMIMFGPLGIRPYVAFSPGSPVNPAGIRIEPPPSPPVAIGTSPPATAAAEPPDEPPAVLVGFHGLPVTPCSFVTLTLRPPNSDAVVCATRLAPAARKRVIAVESWSLTLSRNTSE